MGRTRVWMGGKIGRADPKKLNNAGEIHLFRDVAGKQQYNRGYGSGQEPAPAGETALRRLLQCGFLFLGGFGCRCLFGLAPARYTDACLFPAGNAATGWYPVAGRVRVILRYDGFDVKGVADGFVRLPVALDIDGIFYGCRHFAHRPFFYGARGNTGEEKQRDENKRYHSGCGCRVFSVVLFHVSGREECYLVSAAAVVNVYVYPADAPFEPDGVRQEYLGLYYFVAYFVGRHPRSVEIYSLAENMRREIRGGFFAD